MEIIMTSVFSETHWINKGYSPEEAKYQVKIRRPNTIEYYLYKGFSLEESTHKVREHQRKALEKRLNNCKQLPKHQNPCCIEYYLSKGYSKEEAHLLRSQRQITFTKEKCIEKFGLKNGLNIWNERQEKWQQSLSKRTPEQIKIDNSKKNVWNTLTNTERQQLKEKISIAVKNTVSNRSKEDSIKIGQKIKQGRVTSGFCLSDDLLPSFKIYKRLVITETNRQNLKLLENYTYRGRNAYHLDHLYSIYQGFMDGTLPRIVGHIANLKMVWYKENISKGIKSTLSLIELIDLIKQIDG